MLNSWLSCTYMNNDIWQATIVSGFEKRVHFVQRPNFAIATDLKPGITILQSLHYIRCKFCALPTSSLGVVIASITRGRKSAILCLQLVPHHFR